MTDDADFSGRMRRIERLVADVEAAEDPQLRGQSVELVQLLMDVHRSGFERMISIISESGIAADGILNEAARDPVVSSFLVLYGLHPVDFETRVQRALEKVRPLLQSHGGDVELLSCEEGRVSLRLLGSCHGCPSSAQTLHNAVEEAVYEFAPDIDDLEVEGIVPDPLPSELVPLSVMSPGT